MSGKLRRKLAENFVRGTNIPPKSFHNEVVECIAGRVAVVMVDEPARRPSSDHGKGIIGIFSRSSAVRTADESRSAQYERRQKTTEFFENGFHKFSSLNLFELKIQSN